MRFKLGASLTATLEISTAIAGAAVVRILTKRRRSAACRVNLFNAFDNSCCNRSPSLRLKLQTELRPSRRNQALVISLCVEARHFRLHIHARRAGQSRRRDVQRDDRLAPAAHVARSGIGRRTKIFVSFPGQNTWKPWASSARLVAVATAHLVALHDAFGAPRAKGPCRHAPDPATHKFNPECASRQRLKMRTIAKSQREQRCLEDGVGGRRRLNDFRGRMLRRA